MIIKIIIIVYSNYKIPHTLKKLDDTQQTNYKKNKIVNTDQKFNYKTMSIRNKGFKKKADLKKVFDKIKSEE